MTGAAEREYTDSSGRKVKRWMPTEEKISFAWSDQPFAVHIPFMADSEVHNITPYVMGRPEPVVCSIDYEFAVSGRGFMVPEVKDQDFMPVVHSTGFYRLDRQSVYSNRDERMVFLDDAVTPTHLDRNPTGKPKAIRWSRQHVPGPARMGLWFIFDPRFERTANAWRYATEQISGRLIVSLDQLPYEPPVLDKDRPNQIGKVKQRGKVFSAEFEIIIKQNAWVVQSVKAETLGDWQSKLSTYDDRNWTVRNGTTTLEGSRMITTSHTLIGTPNRSGVLPAQDQVTLRIELPPRLWDHKQTLIQGRITRQGQTGDAKHGLGDCLIRTYQYYTYETNEDLRALGDKTAKNNYTQPYFQREDGPRTREIGIDGGYWPRLFQDGMPGIGGGEWKMKLPPMRASALMSSVRESAYISAARGGTLFPGWTADRRIGPHRLMDIDIQYSRYNPNPQVPLQNLPVKRLSVTGMRLSEIENNAAGQVGTEAPGARQEIADDGYWQWRNRFSDLVEKNTSKVAAIQVILEKQEGEIRSLQSKFLSLQQLSQRELPPDPTAGFDFIETAMEYLVRGGSDIPIGAAISKEALAGLKRTRDQIQAEIAAIKNQEKTEIATALGLIREIVTSVRDQAARSGERRLDLADTIQEYEDIVATTELELYATAGLYGPTELPAVIKKYKFDSQASKDVAKLMEARILLAEAETQERHVIFQQMAGAPMSGADAEASAIAARFGAMLKFREILDSDPENETVRPMLQKEELGLLHRIVAKLEHEKQVSFANFQRYVESRGFSPKDTGGWWDGFKEFMGYWWGSSPLTLYETFAFSGDVPQEPGKVQDAAVSGGVAQEAGEIQWEAAKDQVALLAVRRLLQNGLPLKRIRNITPDLLKEWYTPRTVKGAELPRDKADRLCQDIRTTFAGLPDLLALANGDKEGFMRAYGQRYYGLTDPDKCGAQIAADLLFSPMGLLTFFGPGAICRVGGQWKYSGIAKTEASLLEGATQVERGRDLFVSALRIEELADAMEESRIGRALAQRLRDDAKWWKGLGTAERFARTTAQIAGTIVIYGGAAHAAESSGIPGLRWLVDAIAAFGAEEAVFDALSRVGTPLRKILRGCDQLNTALQSAAVELNDAGRVISSLETMAKKMDDAANAGRSLRLSQEEIRLLQQVQGKYAKSGGTLAGAGGIQKKQTGTAPIGANRKEDLLDAISRAAEALERGNLKEANMALGSSKDSLEKMSMHVQRLKNRMVNAEQRLAASASAGEATVLDGFPKIVDTPPKPFVPEAGYPAGDAGVALEQADEALKKGALDVAEQRCNIAKMLGAEDAQKLAQERLSIIEGIKLAKEKAAKLKPTARPAVPLTQTDETLFLDKLKSGEWNLKSLADEGEGTYNKAYRVLTSDNKATPYFYKAFSNPNDAEEEVAMEVAAAALAEHLGISAPAARRVERRVMKLDPDGIPVRHPVTNEIVFETETGLLTRYVDGKHLRELKEPEVLALKDRLAEQRVLRLWLGDCDGHLRNIMMGEDGQVHALDFGMGQILRNEGLGEGNLTIKLLPDEDVHNAEELLSKAIKHPAIVWQYTKGQGKWSGYAWIHRLDDLLNYKDMEGMVKAIDMLCKHERADLERILKQAFRGNEAKTAAAVKALTERAEKLERTLMIKFDPQQAAKKFRSGSVPWQIRWRQYAGTSILRRELKGLDLAA